MTRPFYFSGYKGCYSEAIKVAEKALKVAEKTFGSTHPNFATALNNMADLYRGIGKEDEAERLEERARKIGSNR